MPIMYVNPARRRKAAATRSKRRVSKKRPIRRPKKRRVSAKRRATKATTRSRTRKPSPRRRPLRKTPTRRVAKRNPARKGRLTTKRSTPSRQAPRKRRRSPARRRATVRRSSSKRRRFRRNPASLGGGLALIAKQAIPIASSLYLSRIASRKLGQLDIPVVPDRLQAPAVASLLFGAGHFATKSKQLRKWRTGVLVGLGLNLIDSLVSAFAPQSVKSMFGLAGADTDIYGPALSDYVAMDDYVALEGAPPIENHLTLSDYVAVGDSDDGLGLEADLGSFEQDLGGIEEDLGDAYEDLGRTDDFANRRIGGVNRRMLTAPINYKHSRGTIPSRSFSRPIRPASSDFDEPGQLYTGNFSGGFGN